MDESVRAHIITELGKHRDRRDVIVDLCHQHNIDWKQADEWVRSVETFDSRQVARRQSPLLILLGTGVLLIGSALTVVGVVDIWNWMQLDSAQKLATAAIIYESGFTLVTGLAMSTGGIIGLRKILGDLL